MLTANTFQLQLLPFWALVPNNFLDMARKCWLQRIFSVDADEDTKAEGSFTQVTSALRLSLSSLCRWAQFFTANNWRNSTISTEYFIAGRFSFEQTQVQSGVITEKWRSMGKKDSTLVQLSKVSNVSKRLKRSWRNGPMCPHKTISSETFDFASLQLVKQDRSCGWLVCEPWQFQLDGLLFKNMVWSQPHVHMTHSLDWKIDLPVFPHLCFGNWLVRRVIVVFHRFETTQEEGKCSARLSIHRFFSLQFAKLIFSWSANFWHPIVSTITVSNSVSEAPHNVEESEPNQFQVDHVLNELDLRRNSEEFIDCHTFAHRTIFPFWTLVSSSGQIFLCVPSSLRQGRFVHTFFEISRLGAIKRHFFSAKVFMFWKDIFSGGLWVNCTLRTLYVDKTIGVFVFILAWHSQHGPKLAAVPSLLTRRQHIVPNLRWNTTQVQITCQEKQVFFWESNQAGQ